MKKLVVLIVDGAPNGLFTLLNGPDPWVMATWFRNDGVVLAVVGVEPSVAECEDFYCALAEKTGRHAGFQPIIRALNSLFSLEDGRYIPLVNASHLLSLAVQRVIEHDMTLCQAFRGVDKGDAQLGALIRYSAIQSRVVGMVADCATMADIRSQYFSY